MVPMKSYIDMLSNTLKCCSHLHLEHTLQSLPVKRAYFPMRYLGLPLSFTRLKRIHFQFLEDKVVAKLPPWIARHVATPGRVVLVKAVLTAIAIYHITPLELPVEVRKKIDSLRRAYLWAGCGKVTGGKCKVTGNSFVSPRAVVVWASSTLRSLLLPFDYDGFGISGLTHPRLGLGREHRAMMMIETCLRQPPWLVLETDVRRSWNHLGSTVCDPKILPQRYLTSPKRNLPRSKKLSSTIIGLVRLIPIMGSPWSISRSSPCYGKSYPLYVTYGSLAARTGHEKRGKERFNATWAFIGLRRCY